MISKRRKLYLWTVRGGMYLATALTAGLTLFLMVYVLAKGIPHITWELLSTKPSYLADRIGILPDILNTLYIIVYTLVLVLPLGVGAAISSMTRRTCASSVTSALICMMPSDGISRRDIS